MFIEKKEERRGEERKKPRWRERGRSGERAESTRARDPGPGGRARASQRRTYRAARLGGAGRELFAPDSRRAGSTSPARPLLALEASRPAGAEDVPDAP